MRALLSVAALLVLSGCVTSEKRLQRDTATCAGQDIQPSTTAMADCVAGLDRRRYAREPAEQGRALGVAGLTVGALMF